MSRMMTSVEAGVLIGASPEQVRGFIEDGELEAHSVSRGTVPKWRISMEAVKAFLERRSRKNCPTRRISG